MTLKLRLVLSILLLNASLFSQKINKAKLVGQWSLTSIQKGLQQTPAGKKSYLLTFYSNDYMERCKLGTTSGDSLKEVFKVWHIQRDEFILSNTELDSNIYIIRTLNDTSLRITFYNPFEEHLPDFSHLFRRSSSFVAGEYPNKIMGEVPFLINSVDTTQRMRIKGESGVFHLISPEVKNDSTFTHHIYGNVVSVKDSTVRFLVKEELVENNQKGKSGTNRVEHKNDNTIKEYNLNVATMQFEDSKKHSSKGNVYKITSKEDFVGKDYWFFKKRVIDLYAQ